MRSLFIAALILMDIFVLAAMQKPEGDGFIQGIVQSGNTPIPGATVTATHAVTGEKLVTSTDLRGQYQIKLPGVGAYIVEASMAAFAPAIKETDIKDVSSTARLDFDLMLLSRSPQTSSGRPDTLGFRGRGAQALPARETASEASAQQASGDVTEQLNSTDLPVAGTADAPTESVAVLGNTAETTFGNNFDFDRERIQRIIDERFGGFPPQEAQANAPALIGPGGRGGGGPRGGGGGRGDGGFFAIGGRGGFNVNRPRGNISYTGGDSALDAAPYSLTGQPAVKPAYNQNRLSASIGGPFKIPKLVSLTNTNYIFTYNATRLRSPYDAFSTVPTLAERRGDFSQTLIRSGAGAGDPVRIFDPGTHVPFPDNRLPRIDPAAASLLAFIPEPNLPGDVQNFHYLTAVTNKSDDINVRLNHTFGESGFGQGTPAGGGFGRRGGGGARRRRQGPQPTNLNFGLQYRNSENRLTNPFPGVGGTNTTDGLNTTIGLVHSFGTITDNLRVNYNINRTASTNLYAFQQDIGGAAGITGVSRSAFDWGIPNLGFTNFTGLNDIRPSTRRDRTVQIQNGFIWSRGRHALRWGGDFRWIQSNLQTDQNARGSFTFTGARTAAVNQGLSPVEGTGYDFTDFLLGLPQLTSIQYGGGKYYFRGTSWDLFVQDDWRVRGNLTFNLGLRYEYVSPVRELNNRMVNLDVAPGFTAVVPAFPGQAGLFTGIFPVGLVQPDRNNFAPRVGIAWRVTNRSILRAGYGINYNTGAYGSLAQQLAFQPPFSVTQTNINSGLQPLTLQNGFPTLPPETVTNNFGVNRDYRIGYVQIWNLDVQREFRSANLTLNLDYTGTKGTHLDVIEAPNRTATGLRIPGVQPFNWETSEANSTAHSGTIRVRRRLQGGFQMGGSYTFSKSIDNASSIGGTGGTVAQNAFDLAAERGLSNFDQSHRLNVDYIWELPFGRERRFLANVPYLAGVLAGWQWSGTWNLASGLPFTARVLGSFTDVNRGTNGTLRANATGISPDLADPSVAQWFNTAAFVVPLAGQFGDVGRNTLRGPSASVFGMALSKIMPFADGRSIELRAQASNIFNTPQFRSIDTNLNSSSFGHVTSAGSMRKIQLTARFRF